MRSYGTTKTTSYVHWKGCKLCPVPCLRFGLPISCNQGVAWVFLSLFSHPQPPKTTVHNSLQGLKRRFFTVRDNSHNTRRLIPVNFLLIRLWTVVHCEKTLRFKPCELLVNCINQGWKGVKMGLVRRSPKKKGNIRNKTNDCLQQEQKCADWRGYIQRLVFVNWDLVRRAIVSEGQNRAVLKSFSHLVLVIILHAQWDPHPRRPLRLHEHNMGKTANTTFM